MSEIARDRETVLLCKWNYDLTLSLLDVAGAVYIVLDDFDVEYMSPDQELLDRAERVYRISDFDSLEEVAAVASDLTLRGARIDRVLSFTEFSQFGAGYLRALLLGVDALPPVAFRDKRLMKDSVSSAGVPVAAWWSLPDPDNTDDVKAICDALRFPVVMKPVAGGGAIGTFTAETPQELRAGLGAISQMPHIRSRQMIAEEFVDGRELHVDTIWANGEPLLMVVSRYAENRLSVAESLDGARTSDRAVGWLADGSTIVPPDEDPDLYRRVSELHHKVNLGLGIEAEVTHMELFERPDGELVFSEIATRLAGAWIGSMLSEYLGYSVFSAVAKGIVGGAISPPRPSRRYIGGYHVRPERPGRITSIPSQREMMALDGILRAEVLRGVGSEVTFSHPSEWCVFIVVGGDTRDEFERALLLASKQLRIEVEPVDGARGGD